MSHMAPRGERELDAYLDMNYGYRLGLELKENGELAREEDPWTAEQGVPPRCRVSVRHVKALKDCPKCKYGTLDPELTGPERTIIGYKCIDCKAEFKPCQVK